MFINDKYYSAEGLSEVGMIRNALYNRFYINPEMIQELQNLIAKELNTATIEFEPSRCAFVLTFNDTNTYVGIVEKIANVYREFINIHMACLCDAIQSMYGELCLEKCCHRINDPKLFWPITSITHLNFNAIQIKL